MTKPLTTSDRIRKDQGIKAYVDSLLLRASRAEDKLEKLSDMLREIMDIKECHHDD